MGLHVSSMPVIANPPSTASIRTLAVVSILVATWPPSARSPASAIEKHPA